MADQFQMFQIDGRDISLKEYVVYSSLFMCLSPCLLAKPAQRDWQPFPKTIQSFAFSLLKQR